MLCRCVQEWVIDECVGLEVTIDVYMHYMQARLAKRDVSYM